MRLQRPRLHRTPAARRAHAAPRPVAPQAVAPTPPALAPEPAAAPRGVELRMRAAGAPEDAETYACRCGAVFPAPPTTSVSCPLCGVHQAW